MLKLYFYMAAASPAYTALSPLLVALLEASNHLRKLLRPRLPHFLEGGREVCSDTQQVPHLLQVRQHIEVRDAVRQAHGQLFLPILK